MITENKNGVLSIKKIVKASCTKCGNWFEVDEEDFEECACPKCESIGWVKGIIKDKMNSTIPNKYIPTFEEVWDRR
tara:strand:+ start:168 stop:395 length:228 start_codon:yes stop_codon:yes gene_type:complete